VGEGYQAHGHGAGEAAGRGDFSRQQRQVLENYMQRRNGPVP